MRMKYQKQEFPTMKIDNVNDKILPLTKNWQ